MKRRTFFVVTLFFCFARSLAVFLYRAESRVEYGSTHYLHTTLVVARKKKEGGAPSQEASAFLADGLPERSIEGACSFAEILDEYSGVGKRVPRGDVLCGSYIYT